MFAVSNGHLECLKVLIEAGVDVNAKETSSGYTAVMYAAEQGNNECLKVLIEAGADVNIKTNDGQTILFTVTDRNLHHRHKKMIDCVEIMLTAGVKVNVRDNQGHSPLTWLLEYLKYGLWIVHARDKELVMLFFAAGETVNETGVRYVPAFLKPSAEICLMNICRETIRKHLLQISQVNLFVRVPRLPLPRLMTSYLLYDVKLHNEKNNVMSDVTKKGEGTTM